MKYEPTAYYDDEKSIRNNQSLTRETCRLIGSVVLFFLYVCLTYLSYPVRILASIVIFLSVVDVGLCLLFFRNQEMIIGMIIMGLSAIAIKIGITALVMFLGDQLGGIN